METIKGAKLEVTVLIDEDLLAELQAQGCADKDIETAIIKSITLTHTVSGNIPTPPVEDIVSVELIKYY